MTAWRSDLLGFLATARSTRVVDLAQDGCAGQGLAGTARGSREPDAGVYGATGQDHCLSRDLLRRLRRDPAVGERQRRPAGGPRGPDTTSPVGPAGSGATPSTRVTIGRRDLLDSRPGHRRAA